MFSETNLGRVSLYPLLCFEEGLVTRPAQPSSPDLCLHLLPLTPVPGYKIHLTGLDPSSLGRQMEALFFSKPSKLSTNQVTVNLGSGAGPRLNHTPADIYLVNPSPSPHPSSSFPHLSSLYPFLLYHYPSPFIHLTSSLYPSFPRPFIFSSHIHPCSFPGFSPHPFILPPSSPTFIPTHITLSLIPTHILSSSLPSVPHPSHRIQFATTASQSETQRGWASGGDTYRVTLRFIMASLLHTLICQLRARQTRCEAHSWSSDWQQDTTDS
ncbi:unnamed protein product [Pleuronectes platessa]|uniref:Uncharacterized protein n=1 Tax=Pleuronectes platessa TaxID=8262 RepID=A0A9N7UEA3_PLEPL|nr:unnamed protein product [Pleuronectes platessa]